MSNHTNSTSKNKLEPTVPQTLDINELAKLWIELLLPQINKDEVVRSGSSIYNITIGQ